MKFVLIRLGDKSDSIVEKSIELTEKDIKSLFTPPLSYNQDTQFTLRKIHKALE